MEDKRARQLAMRIIFNEWPQIFPADEYSRLDRERFARYHHPNAPWMTIPKALAEIAKLRAAQSSGASAILERYAAYLLVLGAFDAA
jgi:hypothetical protein